MVAAIAVIGGVATFLILNSSEEIEPGGVKMVPEVCLEKSTDIDPSTITVNLPSSFSQKDLGIVTSVKVQNPWGTCWAFACTSAAETSILNGQGDDKDSSLDLSEKHLVWFSTHPLVSGESQGHEGEGVYVIDGGWNSNQSFEVAENNSLVSYAYSSGIGPVYEIDFPYHGKTGLSDNQFYTLPEYKDQAIKFLQERFVSEYKDDFDTYYKEAKSTGQHEVFFDLYVGDGYVFPAGTTADNLTAEVFFEAERNYFAKISKLENQYSKEDDWSLVLMADDGSDNRFKKAGYVMLEANDLANFVLSDDGKYSGLSEYAVKLVKKELYEGKGVVVGYNDNELAYNSKTYSIYNNTTGGINHLVQIVGWDDSYSKSNFSDTPEGDGAWLIKNSWGSQTDGYVINGETYYSDIGIKDENGKATGYMWISYYDRTLHEGMSFEFTEDIAGADGYDVYMHDFVYNQGAIVFTTDHETKTANVYVSEKNENIAAISVKTGWAGSRAQVSVYLLDADSENPEDGTKVASFDKTYESGGYHTIVLDKPVSLSKGQKFSIVMTETNSVFYGDRSVYLLSPNLGLSESGAKDGGFGTYCVPIIKDGESFVCQDGKWTDWTKVADGIKEIQNGLAVDSFSLKAYTVEA